jgi:NADPH:quinone reductase-like Zn-dependent oxidoreductase
MSRGDRKFVFFVAKSNQEDLVALTKLMEAGKIVPVIDRRYPLSETAQAMRYHEEGKTRGKIVITVDHDKDKAAWSDSYAPSRERSR